MNMQEALVHRNAHALPEHLSEALDYYQQTRGRLPTQITVHNSLVEATREMLGELGRDGIAVSGLGGCLANEIWLWIPDDEEETPEEDV
jgi:hypothetical protein